MDIDKMIAALKSGDISDNAFKEAVLENHLKDLGDVVLDLQRSFRCGLPEVIFGQSKTVEQMLPAAKSLLEDNNSLLITRISKDKALEVLAGLDGSECQYDESCQALYKMPPVSLDKNVLILTAGTSDISVAREAELTCGMFGVKTTLKPDVGVAGLHRLLNIKHDLLKADCIIVCAGMEGALPSVVGGLVACPVIAVPVSCGYGTSFEGITAMLGMLNSCASGLTVVNVDNGFGAGFAVGRMLGLDRE